ncbi:hypothetical protein Bp8pS_252 [Bacillus phage vB_BpuM-BpSp]|nr:hypothetical protein Bp8pS_252 [Bacillus phage vB_BpuM-BpSp]
MLIREKLSYPSNFKKLNSLNVIDPSDNIRNKNKKFRDYLNSFKDPFPVLSNTRYVNYFTVSNFFVNKVDTSERVTNIFINSDMIDVDLDLEQYLTPMANGLQNARITVLSGRYFKINLNPIITNNDMLISNVKNLPENINFSKDEGVIEGVPFILGEHQFSVFLRSGSEITIILNVVDTNFGKVL